MEEPLWALAAGCVPDATPWDIPRIAASAGFSASGMWVDPKNSWDKAALGKAKLSLRETGIQLIDVEAAWLEKSDRANDYHKWIIEAGLELGARNLLVVSRHEDYHESVSQFLEICNMAHGQLRVCIEFGEFTSIKSLSAAKKFVEDVNHPSAGILIDLMHLNRAQDRLPQLESSLFPYIQACDFWQSSALKSGTDYVTAAVDERCCLGEGEAHASVVAEVCNSNTDVSLEIRSAHLREKYKDPYVRAREIFRRCERKSLG